MLPKIALIPVVAAFALAACHPTGPEASGNDVNATVSNTTVVTNEGDNAAGNEATTNTTTTTTNTATTSNSAAPQSTASGSPTGGTCGGIIGKQCASAKDFCKLPDGQCKVADAQGTCTTKRPICGKIYKPVCGCNGKTYGNVCQANAEGVSVQSQGQCPKG